MGPHILSYKSSGEDPGRRVKGDTAASSHTCTCYLYMKMVRDHAERVTEATDGK